MAHRISRIALVITSLIAVLALTAGVAAAASQLDVLVEINSANDDMNSGAVETSGATYNASRHVLLTVDDERTAYEYQLLPNGEIDPAAEVRLITLALGERDIEGVAWIEGETYGFLSEDAGQVIIATVPAPDAQGETTIRPRHIERSFQVAWGTWGNLGPEGLATDGEAFYVASELPASLTKFDFEGNYVAKVDLFNLADASGVAVLHDGTYLVISHESRRIDHYQIDWDTEQAYLIGLRDADFFSQLEGIAVMGNTDVHLFGEDNTRKGVAGQTYSHLHGAISQYAPGDVDCSGDLNVLDAVIVSRIVSQVEEPREGCGNGDHNLDGTVNIFDAVGISNCTVGIPNVGCPAEVQ